MIQSAPWLYGGSGLGAGIAQMFSAINGQTRDQLDREAQARRDVAFANATGIADAATTRSITPEALLGLIAADAHKNKMAQDAERSAYLAAQINSLLGQDQRANELFPTQLQSAKSNAEQQAALHPLVLQQVQDAIAQRKDEQTAKAAARSAQPQFFQDLQALMQPRPPMADLAPRSMIDALPEALARNPDLVQSDQGRNVLSVIERLATSRAANASQKQVRPPEAVTVGDHTLLWNPNTGSFTVAPATDFGSMTVTTGNADLGEPVQRVTRKFANRAERDAWEKQQRAQPDTGAAIDPAIHDAWNRYQQATAQIEAGNRYVGPEASWLPSFGDRAKDAAAAEAELTSLIGRPVKDLSPAQRQFIGARQYVPPPPKGQTVVVGPDGSAGYIPLDEVPVAQRQGYIVLPTKKAKGK